MLYKIQPIEVKDISYESERAFIKINKVNGLLYNVIVDGHPETINNDTIEVNGEGRHLITISASNTIEELNNCQESDKFNRNYYKVERSKEIDIRIDIPYESPANVISLRNSSYDDRNFNDKVEYEIWEHPFTTTIDPPSDTINNTKHGNYTSNTYKGEVYNNCILKSGVKDRNSKDVYYKSSNWNESIYQNNGRFLWNIENYGNEIFRDNLAYRKVKKDNNFYKGEYLATPKEYRTVDTFLESLNYSSTVIKPEILGIDEEDSIQFAYYPGVKKGMYQYYAAWVDDSPFELNNKTELTNVETYKNSQIKVHTEKMKRDKKGKIYTYGTADSDIKTFKIDTVKPQYPQLNLDIESVMKDPFLLDNVKESSDVQVRYRLRRIIYKYVCDNEEESYDYKKVVGDEIYEEISDFELGNYIWEDGDYLLDIWNYRPINKTFRHRSFYFTVNTMRNLDILPLKAKIIPLNINKYDKSTNEELLLDWITGDYYINVNGEIKSATLELTKDTDKLEELECQRMIDAVDYLDMIEDDIARYEANREFIDDVMEDIHRLVRLYNEYIKVRSESEAKINSNKEYNDIYSKILSLYYKVSSLEDILSRLDVDITMDEIMSERAYNTILSISNKIANANSNLNYLRKFIDPDVIYNKYFEMIKNFKPGCLLQLIGDQLIDKYSIDLEDEGGNLLYGEKPKK